MKSGKNHSFLYCVKSTDCNHFSSAFTIVELLMVIVIIGVLATITIVSYSGVNQRAVETSLKSDLSNASRQLSMFQIENVAYPNTLSCAQADSATNKCIKASANTNYQYTVSNTNPQTFCIAAIQSPNIYKITQDGTLSTGVCPTTNLVINPSFESNLTGWSSNVTTLTRISSGCVQGSSCLQATRNAAGDAYFTFILSPNAPKSMPYTLSFWIWSDSPVTLNSAPEFRHHYSSGWHQIASTSAQVTATPTRIVMSGLTNANSSDGGLQFVGRLPATIGVTVYFDGFMITQGLIAYDYADGNTSGWTWNGTVNNSTSVGTPKW